MLFCRILHFFVEFEFKAKIARWKYVKYSRASWSKAKDPSSIFHHKESISKHLNQRSYCRNFLCSES